jgi:general stress protein YciG
MQTGSSRTRSRGFASMNAEKQREIARKGGRAAHEKGTAHEFTADEARAAGRKGGERVSANREHMSRIGRLGGKMSAGKRQAMASGTGTEMRGNGSQEGASEPGQAERSDHSEPEANPAFPPAMQTP